MRKIALFVASLSLSAYASTAQTHVDYDRKVDFSKYRTFGFQPGRIIRDLDLPDTDSSLINKHVQEVVTAELTKKGLSPVAADADLSITFMAGAKQKQEMENAMTNQRFGYGWGNPYWQYFAVDGWWSAGWNDWWVNEYEQGTLILDIYDTRTKELVWRAYAVANINNYNERRFVERVVNRALMQFPRTKNPRPGAGSASSKALSRIPLFSPNHF
jgi:hypothetical protein